MTNSGTVRLANPIAITADGLFLLTLAPQGGVQAWERTDDSHFTRRKLFATEYPVDGVSICSNVKYEAVYALCTVSASPARPEGGKLLLYKMLPGFGWKLLADYSQEWGIAMARFSTLSFNPDGVGAAVALDNGGIHPFPQGSDANHPLTIGGPLYGGPSIFEGASMVTYPPSDVPHVPEKFRGLQIASVNMGDSVYDHRFQLHYCYYVNPDGSFGDRTWRRSPRAVVDESGTTLQVRCAPAAPAFNPDGKGVEVMLEGGGVEHFERLDDTTLVRRPGQVYATDVPVLGIASCLFNDTLQTVVRTPEGHRLYERDGQGHWSRVP